MRLILAVIFGAVMAVSGEKFAQNHDAGVENMAPQESIIIDAPAPAFHYLPADE